MARSMHERLKAAAAGRSVEALQAELAEALRAEGQDREVVRRMAEYVLSPREVIMQAQELAFALDDQVRQPYIVTEESPREIPMGVAVFWFPKEVADDVRKILKRAYVKSLNVAIRWAMLQPPPPEPDGRDPLSFMPPQPFVTKSQASLSTAAATSGEIVHVSKREDVHAEAIAVEDRDRQEAGAECGSDQLRAGGDESVCSPAADPSAELEGGYGEEPGTADQPSESAQSPPQADRQGEPEEDHSRDPL